MTERSRITEFAQELIGQDHRITEDTIQAFRSDLQVRLVKFRRREAIMRRVVVVMVTTSVLLAAALLLIGAYAPNVQRLLFDNVSDTALILIYVSLLGWLVCAIVLTAMYRGIHQRRLQRAEREELVSLIHQLKDDIASLRNEDVRNHRPHAIDEAESD